jgi:hypothetical protein
VGALDNDTILPSRPHTGAWPHHAHSSHRGYQLMLHLENDEDYVGSDEESQQPSGDRRRSTHECQTGMAFSRGPSLKNGKSEQKNYQQYDRR